MQHDAIIVGGGPAGASLAWAFARRGLRVLLLDRARFPRAKACAEYLSPECARPLSAMGVLDSIEHAGAAQLRGMAIHAPDGTSFRGDFAAAHGFAGFRSRGLAIPRTVLDPLLLDRARQCGTLIVEGAHVRDVVRVGGRTVGVAVHGAPQPEYRAPLVVGADGLRSVVGRRLGLVRARRWPRRIALVAHFSGVAGIGDYGEMHVAHDGYAGLADVGGGRTNVAVVLPRRGARAIGGDPAAAMLRWLGAQPALAPRFRHATRVSAVLATGPFAVHAPRAWAPGAALVGDAADFFDPFTGEGIYSALRGAELLDQALREADLARASTVDDAGRAYERARRAAFGGKWTVERIIGGVVGSPWLMNRAARALAAEQEMADLLVGVAGDFVPPSQVLNPAYIFRLLAAAFRPARDRHLCVPPSRAADLHRPAS